MKVSLWAEIRRLHEVERLTDRAIARRLHCCTKTVAQAWRMTQPPTEKPKPRASILAPHQAHIESLIANYPDLSAVRVLEEISQGENGYRGKIGVLRAYLRRIRPHGGRVYQEVFYEPGEALQVDWGHCGKLLLGTTPRRVSVFVAVLCYSRMIYIEFTLAQRKAEFYRALVHALEFFGGSPKKIIFDNLRAAVINGSGRHACLHPEFLALCGHFCLEPIACERRDPESKGRVESGVGYVQHNALAGRSEELTTWEAYQRLATTWRDDVANVREHGTTKDRPCDRFLKERGLLRALPAVPFDTDEILSTEVSSHARVCYDGNRYSVPPALVGKTVMLRANATELRVLHQGQTQACHARCYEKGQVVVHAEHRLAALKARRRGQARQLEEEFDALGLEARAFHLKLLEMPVKTTIHLRRVLALVRLYGRDDVQAALRQALAYETCDAAYVETLVHQERRRRELPSPTPLSPKRQELIEDIHLEESDPGQYDRLFTNLEEDQP